MSKVNITWNWSWTWSETMGSLPNSLSRYFHVHLLMRIFFFSTIHTTVQHSLVFSIDFHEIYYHYLLHFLYNLFRLKAKSYCGPFAAASAHRITWRGKKVVIFVTYQRVYVKVADPAATRLRGYVEKTTFQIKFSRLVSTWWNESLHSTFCGSPRTKQRLSFSAEKRYLENF